MGCFNKIGKIFMIINIFDGRVYLYVDYKIKENEFKKVIVSELK